jgi:hypothetical protein
MYRRKSISQGNQRELNKLHMTHGEALGMRKDEILKLFIESNYNRSRENTLEALKTNNLLITRGLSFCKCATPVQMVPGPGRSNLCLLCGAQISLDSLSRMYKGTEIVKPSLILNNMDLLYSQKLPERVPERLSAVNRESTEFSGVSSFIPSIASIIDEPIQETRIPKKGKSRTLPILSDELKRRIKLPKLNVSMIDRDRYQKAYLKALHVAKFGQHIPLSWNEFFNQEITPAFVFSYKTHTPNCLNTPHTCRHTRDDKDTIKQQDIHRHIFKNVRVNDFLDLDKS